MTSKEKWNVTRHVDQFHRDSSATKTTHPTATTHQAFPRADSANPSCPAKSIAFGPNASSATSFRHDSNTPPLTNEPALLDSSYHQSEISSTPAEQGNNQSSSKRKWLGNSLYHELVPKYPIKISKKNGDQQRAISWLTLDAKKAFDEKKSLLLAQWGVSAQHKGTCVLLPGAWNRLNPLDLMNDLRPDNCPSRDTQRLMYRDAEHCTWFSRAAAWFSEWPRRGIDLDNFLQCGPFSSMDGSHLCHQNNCLIHLVYEPTHMNLDRKDCRRHAEFLRRERIDIPPYCNNEKHEPRCLLQHAALTTFECFLIQGSILRRSKGLPAQHVKPSHWHTFPTFEDQLPLKFCSGSIVTVVEENLLNETPPPPPLSCVSPRKPIPLHSDFRMRCCFCHQVYKTIQGIWSHIRLKHNNESSRLQEILRTAKLWRDHLEAKGNRKLLSSTASMLEQTSEVDFDWDVVLSWELPYS